MSTPFGHSMRPHFLTSSSYRPLNHGSFGTYPYAVQKALHEYQTLAEARPDTFIRYTYAPLLDKSRALVANLLGVPVDEVVLVSGATIGLNEVLRGLTWEEGDVIVVFETVYGALEKTVEYVCKINKGLEMEKVTIAWPIGDDDLLRSFEDLVQGVQINGIGKRRVRLAIFDTVCSMPGVRMPWERLVAKCKELGVLSLVDAAHGIGMFPLDHLGEVKPDFFVSNLHKWLFVPRACAVLYVPFRNQSLLNGTVPTSQSFWGLPLEDRKNHFVAVHEYLGTQDKSMYLCVPAALQFRKNVCGGEAKITEYVNHLARDGGKKVAELLSTEVMDNQEGTLTKDISLAMVRLPLQIGQEDGQVKEADMGEVREYIAKCATDKFDTYLAVILYRGSWWVRLSAQIYLEMDDFVWAAGVLKELCERVKRGEHVKADTVDGKPVEIDEIQ